MSWPFFQIQRTPAKGLDTEDLLLASTRRSQDASPNGGGGSILDFGLWVLDSGMREQEECGSDDRGGPQAEGALGQPHRHRGGCPPPPPPRVASGGGGPPAAPPHRAPPRDGSGGRRTARPSFLCRPA